VSIWTCDRSARQQWTPIYTDWGTLFANLTATQAAGRLLVLRPRSTANGSQLAIYTYDVTAVNVGNQGWNASMVDFCYTFVTKCS
jgi:hypothetical protein